MVTVTVTVTVTAVVVHTRGPWKKDGAKDLLDVFKHWKPWIPPKREQGFQQARERERERERDRRRRRR